MLNGLFICLFVYVQSEQLESKWQLALAGGESRLCALCRNHQNTCILHNIKYLCLCFKWVELRLLTFYAYISWTILVLHLSHESVDRCAYTSVLVVMPRMSPIDVWNKPRRPWAVCSHDGHVLCLWRKMVNGQMVGSLSAELSSPDGFGGPTCCTCCVEKGTNPRIYMDINGFLWTTFSFCSYWNELVF